MVRQFHILGKKDDFGTIVFLSDVHLIPDETYICYSDRWMMVLAPMFSKNDLNIHSTDAKDDFTVSGKNS